MRMNGNLVFNADASSEIQHAYIERLAAAPTFDALQKGRLYFNTNASLYYYNDGSAWVPFATGGNAASLQTEVDAIEASLGGLINSNGTYVASALTGSLANTTSLTDAIAKLQALADEAAADIAQEIVDRAAAVTAEADAREAADLAEQTAREAADAQLTTDLAAEVTRATAAEAALQTEVDAVEADLAQEITDRENADTALQLNIDGKVSKAGDSMSGNLAMNNNKVTGLATPTAGTDAANKNYVDNLAAGLTWEAPVDAVVADIATFDPVGKADGYRVADLTTGKIHTVTAEVVDAGDQLVDGAAFFDKSNETGYVFNGTSSVQFTGGGQITAGVGLSKDGNALHVNLGAGISQLPTDEVGVDVLGTGGLFLTVDGTTDSTDTGAQLAVRLDGDTITRGAAGLKVSNAVIQSIADAADAAADEQTRAEAAEAALQAEIDAEEVARAAADTALAGDIDALEGKVNKMFFLYEAGAAATSHTVTHNLGQKYCNVTIVDDTDNVVIPQAIVFNTANQLTVTFTTALQCKAIVMGLAA